MVVEPERRVFSVDDFYRMGSAGVFSDGERVELLGGEIIEMAPIGSAHASTVGRLTQLLVTAVGDRGAVWVQNPIRLSELSEPQPDVAVLRPRSDWYASGHPGPEDVLLLIEVADTTGRFDRTVKRPLYAEAGIAEVWIVDLAANLVEIAVDPTPDGYGDIRQIAAGGIITPTAFPDLQLPTAGLLDRTGR